MRTFDQIAKEAATLARTTDGADRQLASLVAELADKLATIEQRTGLGGPIIREDSSYPGVHTEESERR